MKSCTRKKASAHETLEIHVRFTDESGLYDRVRFALLASATWWRKPVGMVVWSVVHALLILGGASLMVPVAPIWFVSVLDEWTFLKNKQRNGLEFHLALVGSGA